MNMKWSLNLGKIAGIRLSIHWTFIILIAWIFFVYYRAGGTTQQALMGVVFILVLFACVILHELGHALTARRYNIQTKSITMLPIGGLAQMEKMPEQPEQELWVAAAGPAVNVVIAALLYLYLRLSGSWPDFANTDLENLGIEGFGFWFNLFVANVVLVAFNLIPAFPMDGGRILRALLAFRQPRSQATKIAAGIGQFLAILFIFLGFFVNVWLIFIGIFIYLGAGAEAFHETTKSVLEGHTVRDVVMENFTALVSGQSLQSVVHLLLDGQQTEFIVVDNGDVTGVVTREELIKGLSEYGKEASVSQIIRTDYLTLTPEMPLTEVYQKILAGSCNVAPVLQDGSLVGMVDKENINELIMVNQALQARNASQF